MTKGAPPASPPAETRALLDRIDTGTVVGLRDRALLSVMVYSFARVSATVGMRQDYFRQGTRTVQRRGMCLATRQFASGPTRFCGLPSGSMLRSDGVLPTSPRVWAARGMARPVSVALIIA